MSVGLYTHTTRGTGTTLTASIYNADHTNHITNQNPSMTGAYSDNVTQMQLNTDPGGLGSESLAGSLAGELERLRFAVKRITGKAQWYIAPATNLDSIPGGGGPLTAAGTATLLTMTRTENDTTERSVELIQSGSGAGDDYERRLVGGGANNIAEIREYFGAVETDRKTATLRTIQTDLKIGANTIIDADGFFELSEISAPGSPAANKLRLYSKDPDLLVFKNSSGVETQIGGGGIVPAAEFRTGSATITIPTGATKCKVTLVGGGGGGGTGNGSGCCATGVGGSGGGGATVEKYLSGLTPGNTLTLTVGAAGAAGGSGGNSILASGTQSITTLTAAGGGGGGNSAAGGAGTNGAGGAGTNGDLNISGADGVHSGQGNVTGRAGGDSTRGHGARQTALAVGAAGNLYGGGGAGGASGTSAAGGAGAAGCAIFEWYV